MEIGPGLGVAIMMNNYFHDVATALLAASAFTLWVLSRVHGSRPGREAAELFLGAYGKMTLLLRVALVWIVLGGIPRTIFYRDFEWANAAGRGQVAALAVKHVLMFALVIGGAIAWRRLARRAAALRASLG